MRKVVGSGSGLPRVGSRWCHTLTHFLPLLLSFARSFFAPSHRKVPRTLFRIPRSFLFISRTPHGCTIPLSARDRPPFRAVGRVRTGPAETETPPKCAAHRGNRFYVSLMVCITQRPGQKWGVWKMYYIYFFEFLPRPGAPHFGPLLSLPFRPYQVCRLHIFAHFCSVFAHFRLVERGRVSTWATFPRAISRPGPRAGIRTSRTNFSKSSTATTSGWENVGTGRRKNLFRAHRQLAHANHSRPEGEVPTPESEPTPLQRDFLW